MAGRVVLIAALLLTIVACKSDGQTEPWTAAAPIDGPWQPVPIALAGPIIEAVDLACRGTFDEFPQQARLVVVDARGAGFIQAQYAGPNGVEATCINMTIDVTGRIVVGGGGTGFGGQEWRVLQAFELENRGGFGSDESSTVVGRAGAGIGKVVIAMPGQPPVTASLANGWYFAWQPGSWPPGTKVFGLDSLGQQVAEAPIQ